MKPGGTHTNFPSGKRVLVILRDGSRFVAKFDQTDYKKKVVRFHDHDPVRLNRLRSMGIYKGTT